MELTQEQVKKAIDGRPAGISPQQVLQGLMDRGHTLQGYGAKEPGFQGTEVGKSIAERMRQDTMRNGSFMESAFAAAQPGIEKIAQQYRQGQISGTSAVIQTGIRTVAAPISKAFGELLSAPYKALRGLSPATEEEVKATEGEIKSFVSPVTQPIAKGAQYLESRFPVASSYLGTAAAAADIAGVVAPAGYLGRNIIGAPAAEGLGIAANVGGKAVAAPVKAATSYGTEVLGKVTGTSGETIRQSFRSAGEEGFISTLRGARTADDVLNDVRSGMQQIKDQRSLLYGEDYAKLKDSAQQIDLTPIRQKFADKLQNDFRVSIEDGKLDFSRSTITGNTAQKELQEAFDDVFKWDETTPVGMDVLKRRTADRWRGVEDSRASDAIITSLKNDIKNTISREVPEYARMSATYEKISKDLKDIEKTLSLGRGVMPQTAVTKLNSVLRENFAARKQMVELLEQYTGQGIFGQVAGLQLNSLMGRGLMGLAQGGVGLYGVLANPAILIGLAASSPRIIGEVANALGKSKKWLENALNNIKGNVSGTVAIGAPGVVNPILGKKGLNLFDDAETLRAAKAKREEIEAGKAAEAKFQQERIAAAAELEQNRKILAAEAARKAAPGGSLEPKLQEIFRLAISTAENPRSRGHIEIADILSAKLKSGEITTEQAEAIVAEYVKKRIADAPEKYRDTVAATALKEEKQIMDMVEKATTVSQKSETPVLAQADGQGVANVQPSTNRSVMNLPEGVRPASIAPKLKGGDNVQVGNFTKVETEFGSTQLPELAEYKGFKIVEDNAGNVSVYNPKMKTLERVSVDDTKGTYGIRVSVDKYNTVGNAKSYIDYLTESWSKKSDEFRAKNDPSFGLNSTKGLPPNKEVKTKLTPAKQSGSEKYKK